MHNLPREERDQLRKRIRSVLGELGYSQEQKIARILGMLETVYCLGQEKMQQQAFQFPERHGIRR